jgi:Protein of unknown function (DUF2752)
MVTWLGNHLLPCAFKTLFGFDCPVCGFQRAFLLMLEGRFSDSFKEYPPLIPCLLFILIIAIYVINKRFVKPLIIKTSCISILAIIAINYFIKISFLAFS